MTASGEREDGVSIAPVAPPLEFPSPTGSPAERTNGTVDGKARGMPLADDSGLPSRHSPAQPSRSMSGAIAAPAKPKRRKGPVRWETSIELRNQDVLKSETKPEGTAAKPSRPGLSGRHTSFGRKARSGDDARREGSFSDPKRSPHVGPSPGFLLDNDHFRARAKLSSRDGRLGLSMHDGNTGYLAKALGAGLERQFLGRPEEDADADPDTLEERGEELARTESRAAGVDNRGHPTTLERDLDRPVPKLNIVVMVLGSRGDIQPFLKIGQILREHGHRVRIASHPAFREFVERDTGLEFFSVGGDPAELMAFMVKNPGLIPSMDAVRSGEIGRQREQMFHMFQGFWRACINASDDEPNTHNVRMMSQSNPFIADAIIANPASFAHVHCAERLGVPLHLMFTFPQTPTTEFPNPLAKIKRTNINVKYSNFMSYPLVEMITWQGLGDLVNLFRVETLGLEPVSTLWAPGQLYRQRVPFTYLWSPGLVPKPHDWGPEIDVAGFVFLNLASSFEPPASLSSFLDNGPPPIYIGFGSIVVDDPDRFTAIIFSAVRKAGVRALVSKGWGGLGVGDIPENVYLLDNTPHDWIFPRVSAVIHHGGAGTTAIGLKCGRPTMIVPFFGDQPFWAERIAKANAGYYEPVPYKRLTVDKLVDGIRVLSSPDIQANAQLLAEDIAKEGDGAHNAVVSFHRQLPLTGDRSMRCSILEDRAAVWTLKQTSLRLSALAAQLLVARKKLHWRQLRLIRHYEWNDFSGPGEPVTGAGGVIVRSVTGITKGFSSVPVKVVKGIHRHRKKRAGTAAPKTEPANDVVTKSDRSSSVSKTSPSRQHRAGSISPGAKERADQDDDGDYSSDSSSDDSDDDQPEEDNAAEVIAKDVERSLEKSGKMIIQAPMAVTLAIGQGLHNAPRLYGDDTVRRPTRITGLHSGLRAAGEEFVYGIYDGVTGLVLHPYHGARKDGVVGLAKGFGKGVGGFVLKDLAAIVGPLGYTLKGVHKELRKHKDASHFIRHARMKQGQQERSDLTSGDETAVLGTVDHGWGVFLEMRRFVTRKKSQGIQGRLDLRHEEKRWHDDGAFENVARTKQAVDASKEAERAEGNTNLRAPDSDGSERGEDRMTSRSNNGAAVSPAKAGIETGRGT